MAQVRESTIVKNILRYLNDTPDCRAERRHGGTYGTRGRPDVTACYKGRRLELEVKANNKKPTILQEKELQAWRDAGALAAVVWSVEEVQEIIQWLKEEDRCY